MIGVMALVGLFALIMLRVPVAVALGLAGVVGYAAIDGWERAFIAAGLTPYDLTDKYDLTVVPLFMLMGAVASRSGMSARAVPRRQRHVQRAARRARHGHHRRLRRLRRDLRLFACDRRDDDARRDPRDAQIRL